MLKVTNFKKIDKKGLLAGFDVELDDITVSRCKLVKFDKGYFISGPTEKYEDKETGKTKFFELTRFNGETKNKVLDTVLALYGVPKQSTVSDDDIPF